jgi:hypothetical protein
MYKRYYVGRKKATTPTYQPRDKRLNFLKNWRVVRYYIMRRYNITQVELEMILYLYDENVFTKRDFKDFEQSMAWRKERFDHMIEKEYIRLWRKGYEGQANMYELTMKAKMICNQTYKKLTGEEHISESPHQNIVFKGEKYMDKIYRRLIKKMNERRDASKDI